MDLLTKSDFKQGIIQGVPSNNKVAHKFGERFTASELVQLHESAIVYRGSASYVITIMTEGKNMDELKSALGSLSKICFEQQKAQSPVLAPRKPSQA